MNSPLPVPYKLITHTGICTTCGIKDACFENKHTCRDYVKVYIPLTLEERKQRDRERAKRQWKPAKYAVLRYRYYKGEEASV